MTFFDNPEGVIGKDLLICNNMVTLIWKAVEKSAAVSSFMNIPRILLGILLQIQKYSTDSGRGEKRLR